MGFGASSRKGPEELEPERPAYTGPSGDVQLLAGQWLNGLRIAHKGHHRACGRFEYRARYIGIAVVVLSTAVGTAIFSSMSDSPARWARITAGTLSLAAAVATALNTVLGYAQLGARHREAASAYGVLRRRLEQGVASTSREELTALLTDIRAEWDRIDSAVPSLPRRLHDRVEREVLEEKKRRDL